MADGDSNPRPIHDHCAVCGAAVRWGDALVSVSLTVERLTPEGDIVIDHGDHLACLCSACGPRYPKEAVRVSFVGLDGA